MIPDLKTKMVMSSSSKLLLIYSILILACVSVERRNVSNENKKKIIHEFEKHFEKIRDVELTKKVYERANDTINNWVKNRLQFWAGERLNYSYKIDTILCFNTEKSKMIGVILLKTLEKN